VGFVGAEMVPLFAATEVTTTRSERQTPSPGTTLVELLQVAAVHAPPRNTWFALVHARQLLGPDPEQLEQLASQGWHVLEVVSKNSTLLHVGRHRPLVSTGRLDGQLAHWVKDGPLHVAQSGWHARHAPDAENVLEGHVLTHFPFNASWLLGQVRQVVGEPEHVLQLASQASQDRSDMKAYSGG
jgi:hypothetical protein